MATARVEQIIRHFRENGLKLLLEDPANPRELMSLTATPRRRPWRGRARWAGCWS